MTSLVPSGATLFSLSMAVTGLLHRYGRQPCEQPTHEQEEVLQLEDAVSSQRHDEKNQDVKRHNSNHSLPPDFHVVVIGGGIGGLATALALQQRGIRCTVYERDRVFEDRKQGFGLTLSNTPKGGLAKLGILEDCIRQDCNSNAHWVFTPEGKILGYYGRAFKAKKQRIGSSNGSNSPSSSPSMHRGNLRIPRQDLRRLLLDRLTPGTVQWKHQCVSLQEHRHEQGRGGKDCVIVSFENGLTVEADLVVGADGLRSRVRQLRDQSMGMNVGMSTSSGKHAEEQQSCNSEKQTCIGSDKSLGKQELHEVVRESSGIQYIGVSVILGISTYQHPLLAQQGYYVLDGTHRLFTMPFREDEEGRTVQTMWQLSFSGLSEGEANLLKMAGPRAQLVDACRRTSGWFPSARALIQGTAEADVWSTPLYDRDPMVSRLRPRKGGGGGRCGGGEGGLITVLGDACHPMSMFKGQGANQALEDAPRLVDWLLKQGKQFSSLTVPMRVYHFEKEMKDRTSKWVLASRSASQFLHSPAALDGGVDGLFGIDGLARADSDALLALLAERGVTAEDPSLMSADTKCENESEKASKWLEGRVLELFEQQILKGVREQQGIVP